MKKNEVVLQEEISDCGVCSLLSVIRHYNGNISLEKLRYLTNTNEFGVTAYNLIECAKKIGFEAKGVKLLSDNVTCPFIAHLKLKNGLFHFVVIHELNEYFVNMMDPSCGMKKISREEFDSIFTNIAITLYPRISLANYQEKKSISNEIISSIKSNYKSYIKLIVLNSFYVLFSIIISFSFDIIKNQNLAYYEIILLTLLLFILLKYTIEYLISLNVEKLKAIISLEVVSTFLSHIFNLPLKYLHMKDSKEIIKRVDELDGLKEYYCDILINIFINTLVILPILIILFKLNYMLLIIYLVYLIITYIIVTIYVYKTKYRLVIEELIDAKTSYNSKLIDYIGGLISLKHSSITNPVNNVITPFKDSLDAEVLFNKIITRLKVILNSINQVLVLLVFAYLYLSNYNYALTVYFLLDLTISTSIEFFNLIPNKIFIKKYVEKINDFYNLESEAIREKKKEKCNISISDLNFSYNDYDLVLKNYNEVFKYGEHILLKGKSGSGKSTLCKILNRDYDYNGSIKMGKKELSKMKTNIITFASQNEHIFSDTIRNNILLGRDISENEFNSIIDLCCIKEIVNKRINGLDHFIFSEDELSGGEKQRIILARTLINSSDIIILDETLSETNTKLENLIIRSMLKKYKDKTIIYVTHKSSVDKYFDRIVYV